MPSERFLNLAKDKRTKIIDAAIEEFVSVDYEKVSINKRIKKAEISRGSFYTYFVDKEDLFMYIVKDYLGFVYSFIAQNFYDSNRDIFETAVNVVDKAMILETNSIHAGIIRNMASLDSMLRKLIELGLAGGPGSEEEDDGIHLARILYNNGKEEYRKSFEDFYFVLDILFSQALRAIDGFLTYKKLYGKGPGDKDVEFNRKAFKRQIEMVKTGYLNIS